MNTSSAVDSASASPTGSDSTDSPNVLYRFFSRTGQLLYVGITMNPPERFKAHSQTKVWWAQVAGITCESYDNRADLLAAERRAIQIERPEHNVVHNGKAKLDKAPSHSQTDRGGSAHPALSSPLLAGRWFHTTRTCDCPRAARVASWQGKVIGEPAPGVLLIELYEWLMGEPYGQELISLPDFMSKQPVLYDGPDDMRFSYSHGQLAHSSRCGADFILGGEA